ncbi:YdeI/OmpD-associated family protein [Marivirga sp. S37H4]|uniref:YdeI/OmpD-associated family protein n=1 Tax=Marivirga aurantiaca TaxID=2802615 RepID=A0A935C606_9BACT|nr:YdeI/OmpD-associated family protein [Marivirga aurantiaca]MBK6264176.1 YdeI/OmpD-associated family protein [Marivirga aurantiaca]
MHQFSSRLLRFDSNLWQYHFSVPEDLARKLIIADNKRVVCTLNGEAKWPAAIMKSEAYWFILVNKKIVNQLRIQEGSELKVQLEKDHSTYGFEMPEELEVLFDQDEEAYHYFKQLTLGKQRSLIYIVIKVKNPDSRLKKALAIAHHLKEIKGQLDFKLLNETIKVYNKKAL